MDYFKYVWEEQCYITRKIKEDFLHDFYEDFLRSSVEGLRKFKGIFKILPLFSLAVISLIGLLFLPIILPIIYLLFVLIVIPISCFDIEDFGKGFSKFWKRFVYDGYK